MSFILPLVEKAIGEAVKGNTCVVFLLESKKDRAHWVQITWDMVNLSYPLPHDPLQTLAKMGVNGLEDGLCGWKAMKFATFEHGGKAGEIVRFVENYVCKVFGITDIEFEMKIEEQDS